jgi:hypothetical protein
MPFFKTRRPSRVTIDPSCKGLAAAFDPTVHASALKLLATATDPLINVGAGRAEWGEHISMPLFGGRPWIGHPFTEGQTHRMSFDRIMRARPTALENLATGYHPGSIFLHVHPNPNDPGLISSDDKALGIPVMAIDTKGRMSCAF